MVMGRREGVARSSWPIAATDLVGLAGQLTLALGRVPFRKPWSGDGNLPHNLAVAVTRETIRSFMGYLTSLPIEEFRSIELVLDDLSGAALPRWCGRSTSTSEPSEVAGVPGIWYRPRGATAGRDRALPARRRVRGHLAPDVRGVRRLAVPPDRMRHLRGRPPAGPRVPVPGRARGCRAGPRGPAGRGAPIRPGCSWPATPAAGDWWRPSCTRCSRTHHRPIAGVMLFSPELDLLLDEPSVSDNADRDILPWNIPTTAYLHGRDPGSAVGVRRSTRTWPDGPRPSSPSAATRCSVTPSGIFVTHLEGAGVDTTAIEEPGMFHVFPILMPWAEGSRRAYRAVGEFVRAHLPDGRSADHGNPPSVPTAS